MTYTAPISPAKYAQQITDQRHEDDTTPWADSPEDVTTRTIPLDGGTAIIEHLENRVELTIRLHDRIIAGLALSHLEAANIGRALHSPEGATVQDLLHVADTLRVDAADLMRAGAR